MDGLYNNLKHARINDYCNRSALFQQYSAWYRNRIAGFIKELLLDSRSTSRNYIVKCILEKAVLESLNGTGAISLEICLLATAELFSRLFIDRK
jgi:predicted ATP-binding protein involved in virulence